MHIRNALSMYSNKQVKNTKGGEKINHVNICQKEASVALLTPDKGAFRAKFITSDKEVHFIMINESVHQKSYKNPKHLCT